ncbi:unnamed protein product [Peniophora sp. CBMAI 1063]|nr:unnamed protein product [Peniophora sp. CBMAI 1063]
MLQDESREHASSLSLRQSYSTAIIRLVNGLVDPLQVGVYARSIASIAAQLGLPGWLVELRHAATHEDLPSLELLRQAAGESLDWLFHNYFMPTLNPLTASTRRLAEPRPLGPLLAQYKSLSKVTSRDTTLTNQYQAEIQTCLREIERWISEAKISASSTLGLVDGDEDDREAQALDQFCVELLARGVLVPLSKKKRLPPKGQAFPPAGIVAIWTPLLDHVLLHHPSFPSVFMTRAILSLLPRTTEEQAQEFDARGDIDADELSYQHCVSSWVAWFAHSESDGASRWREEAFIMLASGLAPGNEEDKSRKVARSLLASLGADDEHLLSLGERILAAARPSDDSLQTTTEPRWGSEDMDIMDDRLAALLALPGADASAPTEDVEMDAVTEAPEDGRLPQGWRKASANWTPCPIGVYVAA